MNSSTQVTGLELFKSLIKDGCEWHGDVVSRKWSECLYVSSSNETIQKRVRTTLERYAEGVDYKRDGDSIWIA